MIPTDNRFSLSGAFFQGAGLDGLGPRLTSFAPGCAEWLKFSGAQRWMLPWMYDEIAEMNDLFEGNPWPYGLEANRHTLELLMQFLADQKLIEAAVPVDDLFTPIVEWKG